MNEESSGLLAWIKRNAGYKILAVIIAVLLYAIANDQQNPPTTRSVYVAPQLVNLPDDMVLKSGPPSGVIMVSGQSAAVTSFNAQPIKALIDVGKGKVGVNRLPIVYKYAPGTLDIESSPTTAEVVLERKISSSFLVEPVLDNDAPSGYMYGEPLVRPRKVTVYGSATEVARVGRIIAQVENTDNSRAIESDVLLSAQDLHKQGVDTVQIEPARVHVSVDLKKSQGAKSVLLSAMMTGSPAPGFVVVGYTFAPPMLTITGSQTLLASRSSLTVSLVVDGVSQSEVRTVKIVPPAGLMLQNPEQSSVRVRLDVRRIAPSRSIPVAGAEEPVATPRPSSGTPLRPVPTPAPSAMPAIPLAPAPGSGSNPNETPVKE